MLGEKIIEETGEITSQRVIAVEGRPSRLETNVKVTGKVLGVDFTGTLTYLADPNPLGGNLLGRGEGIYMTKDGDLITFIGIATGKPTGKGLASSWRGGCCYQTSSKKLARLNGVSTTFEYDVDESGVSHCNEWELK